MKEGSRYRAALFDRPIGRWRARRVLAMQDAIDEGHASREWETGRVYLDEAVYIDEEPGDEPLEPKMQRLAQALVFHMRLGGHAIDEAEARLESARSEGETAMWRDLIAWLTTIKRQADQMADEAARRGAEG